MKEIGYIFKNKKFLNDALTHCSFSAENYERLEFLGDSILDFLVAEYFFYQTDQNEGVLTKLRSNFVSEKYLCGIFDKLDLSSKVKLGKSYKGQISDAVKADVIESLIAGIYLDCKDLDVVRKIIINLLQLEDYKSHVMHDYKSELQEFVQSKNKKVNYRLIKKSGESHSPVWTMGVFMDGCKICEGTSTSKSKAEQICAKLALKSIKENIDD